MTSETQTTQPITREQLERWKRLCEAASAGPWDSTPRDNRRGFNARVRAPEMLCGHKRDKTRRGTVCEVDDNAGRFDDEVNADARFIAESRTALPALISEVERLTAYAAMARCFISDVLSDSESNRYPIATDGEHTARRLLGRT